MKLRGTVIDGDGNAAQEMTEAGYRADFWKLNFGHLEPGTLNVELTQPHLIDSEVVFHRREDGVDVHVQRCHVENLQGFIVQEVPTGEKPDPRAMLKVVSAFPLRRYLRISDGSEITLKLSAPAQPSSDVEGRQ